MNATIKPVTSAVALVTVGAQERTIEMDQVSQMATTLKANGLTVKIILKANGYRISADVENELLSMAGVSSFQAAKIAASGSIVL